MFYPDMEDLRLRLAENALAVCRYYLSRGQRCGNYWTVGDVHNAPGRSLFVRLRPDGSGGKAGRWTDAATGEFGDLLDIIRLGLSLNAFGEIISEAERFLGSTPSRPHARFQTDRAPRTNRTCQAHRLLSETGPIESTLGETYLSNRGINISLAPGLRFSPSCYCRPSEGSEITAWAAIIAPVTDLAETVTGVHRIYLDAESLDGPSLGKAPISRPKRSLGLIHRHAVHFGPVEDVVVVGEGIENVLSIRAAFPDLTVHAALTAGNLAAYQIHPCVRHLLVAGDGDEYGRQAVSALLERAAALGIQVSPLWPRRSDHNADLRHFGPEQTRSNLLAQIDTKDRDLLVAKLGRPCHDNNYAARNTGNFAIPVETERGLSGAHGAKGP